MPHTHLKTMRTSDTNFKLQHNFIFLSCRATMQALSISPSSTFATTYHPSCEQSP